MQTRENSAQSHVRELVGKDTRRDGRGERFVLGPRKPGKSQATFSYIAHSGSVKGQYLEVLIGLPLSYY